MSGSHAGGFTCAQVDAGSQNLAEAVVRLRDERDAARRALETLRALLVACDGIPDVVISKWACSPGRLWEPVRAAIVERRLAEGFDVAGADLDAFDAQGWLRSRERRPQ